MTIDLDDIPIGDLDFLKHVAEVSKPVLAKDLVEKAPASVEKEIKTIRNAIKNKDMESLKEACHSLKGASYSVRVVRLAKMAAIMEEHSSDLSAAENLLPALEEIAAQTIAWWQEVLDKNLIEG